MTRILITNDDGIHSDGLGTLERALRELGDVYVVAPASEMSGASHSLTLARPLRIRQIDSRHWTVDGTPTDCVTLALHKILGEDELPHVCVSGINHGGNLGDDATYRELWRCVGSNDSRRAGLAVVWLRVRTLILQKRRALRCSPHAKFSAKVCRRARC